MDDEPDVRNISTKILESKGYSCETAEDGLKALEYLEEHKNNLPNLILSDIDMPLCGGIELVDRCRKIYLDLPFLMYSGNVDKHMDKLNERNLSYIKKPFILNDLIIKVQGLIK